MSSPAPPRVSLLIPCRNEARHIRRCLDSLLGGEFPIAELEILVVDGMSDDGTRGIVTDYARQHPAVRLLDNPRRITPTALNAGIRAARGDVIVRVDAHVDYPPHYVRRLVEALQESGADNVGAVLETTPANDGPLARAIAVAMAHPFGVGNSYFRIGTTEPRWVDTIAFFCCRREIFDRVGLFDEDLVRAQDAEFNARLIARGGRILLIPDVVARYFARETMRQVARMFYQYGYFKPLMARKVGRVMTLRQIVPAAFVAALGITAGATVVFPPAGFVFAGIVSAYAAVAATMAARASRTLGLRGALALASVFPVLHISYGVGFLKRLAEFARQPGARPRDAAELPLSR